MVIQPTPLEAVHVQPDLAITETVPVPALLLNDWLSGKTEKIQPAPAWVTVKVFPAMVTVAVRGSKEGLGATTKLSVPVPPDEPPGSTTEVRLIQRALVWGVAPHGPVIVTARLPLPPLCSKA